MQEDTKARSINMPIIRLIDIVKIHWKVQAIVHFSLGLPIAFLTVYSWGIPLPALARLSLAYMDLYFFIYFPLYYFLPRLIFRPIQTEIRKFNTGVHLTDSEIQRLTSYLMNCPFPIGALTAFIEFSAFAIGAFVWTTGIFVPELIPIMNIALFETFLLGVVIAINVSFLNGIMIESHMRNTVEHITAIYPQAFNSNISIKRVSMYTRVFFLIFLTTFAGELSILIFFTTYILTTNPEKFFQNISFVASIILINLLYIFILAPIVARNFTTPIHKLVKWIGEISSGNWESRIRFITNDETGDIIRGSNIMVDRLEKSRDLIELERNKLSTVLFGVVDGVIALDSNHKITLLNKAAEDITGWRPDLAVGQPILDVFHLIDEDGKEIVSTDYCPSLQKGSAISERFSHSNLKLITKKGKTKYINLTCSTITQKIGTDTSFILTFHDVTNEMELENMKLDFVSMAAHELRTPVTVIKGYLDVFLGENKEKLNVDQTTMISRVYSTSLQLASLIDSLLSVSRIERKALLLNLEEIDWRQFVKDTVASCRYMVEDKQQKLECVFSDTFDAKVECDKVRLGEVLGNLINNAVTYTANGGTIRIIVEDQPNAVVTHIQDTGAGIPESAIPRLFTKFFRVSTTLTANSKGNGLGLYLSKAIVEMHKGKIWVESKVGKGSTFSFSLPKKQPTA